MLETFIFPIAAMLTGLAILLLLIRPYEGFLLVLVIKPIVNATWATTFGGANLLLILGGAVPLLLIPRIISQPIWKQPRYRTWWLLAILYFVSQSLGAILFFPVNEAMVGFEILLRYLNGLLGFLMIPFFVRDDKRFKQVLLAIIIAGLFPMLVGIYQEATGTVWHVRQTVGLQRNVGLYHDAVFIRQLGMICILAVLMYMDMFRPKNILAKTLIALYALGWLIVIYNAYTRGAAVTLSAWFIILSIVYRKLHWGVVIAGLIGALVIMSGVDLESEVTQLFSKELSAYQGEADYRYMLNGRFFTWEAALEYWENMDLINKVFGEAKFYPAHNEFIHTLINGGIVGLGIYSIVVLCMFVMVGIRVLSFKQRSKMAIYALMVLAMYTVSIVGGTPSYTIYFQWITFGIIGVCVLNGDSKRGQNFLKYGNRNSSRKNVQAKQSRGFPLTR